MLESERLPEHWELQLAHLALANLDHSERPFLFKHGRMTVYVVPAVNSLSVYYGIRKTETVEALEKQKPRCRAYAVFNVNETNPTITVLNSWGNFRCIAELKKWSIQRPC
jgi:hypothetical protein